MRWLIVICIMLACMATALASNNTKEHEETRPKRDLQYWKDLIATTLGLAPPKPVINQDVKIFRIPGFEKVLVRAVPKVMVEAPVPERVVPMDPTLLAIQSYLGTQTPDQTVAALQGVKNLLQSGVLTARQDLIELPPSNPPVFFAPPLVQQKADCPEQRPLQVIQKTVIPMSAPAFHYPAPQFPVPSLIPVLPPPAPVFSAVPVAPIPELRPLSPPPMPLPPPPLISVPTKYSYQQTNADGSVTSYLSQDNQEIVVTETGTPLPPPPPYIIDRFQKIIFGMPLGVTMTPVPPPTPVPVFVGHRPVADVVVPPPPPPMFAEPVLPIITKPDDVEVIVKHHNKKLHEGMINIYEGTKIANPKPNNSVEKDSFKTKPSEASVQWEYISKLPPPPPELLRRYEKVIGKRPNGMWEYSMKISNGEGTYESLDGGKIYYSHLLPGEPALPAPLSSQSDDENEVPHGDVYVIGEDTETDEFGKPFLSTKIKEEEPPSTTINPDLQPVKKFPPLPTPIAGENEKSEIPKNLDTAKNNEIFPLPNLDLIRNNDGSSGFSYTLINHDGTVKKITKDGNINEGEIVAEAHKPVLPSFIIEERPLLAPAPVTEMKIENSGFSYTQINSAEKTKNTEDNQVHQAVNIPVRPAIILKPIAPAPSLLAVEDCLKGFSYTQFNGGEVTVTKENRRKPVLVQKMEGVPVVHEAPTIIDVIKPAPPPLLVGFGERRPEIVHEVQQIPVLPPAPALVQKVEIFPVLPPPPPPGFVDIVNPAGPVAVKVGKNNGPVMFAEPVVSSYTYKQISHTNPQPFTVVPVGNQPLIEVPNGEVRVEVNRHHHRKPDGTVYPCSEVHMVPTADPVIPIEIPDAPIPPLPTGAVVSTLPKDFLYIPPVAVDAAPPSSQKDEVTNQGAQLSYSQVFNATSTVPSTSTEGTTSAASVSTPLSLSLNPIVVAPEGSNYSYTQTHLDGSSINIQGNKEEVHVNVNDKASNRGDIPEALA